MFDLNTQMSVLNMEFSQIKIFILWDKICKIYNVVQNPRQWLLRCKMLHLYHLQIWSSKVFEIRIPARFKFFQNLKKRIVKFSVKVLRRFDIILLIWSVRLFFFTHDNYD